MIEIDNQTDLEIDSVLLENILAHLSVRSVELMVVEDDTIQALNKTYRCKDSVTDVLSFPIDNSFGHSQIPLGSIVVSSSLIQKKAKLFNHTVTHEMALLFIHGMLHLLGFDHERDKGQMREKEVEVINHFNLPKSLIVRSEVPPEEVSLKKEC